MSYTTICEHEGHEGGLSKIVNGFPNDVRVIADFERQEITCYYGEIVHEVGP